MKRLLRHVAQLVPALASVSLLLFVLRSADLGRAFAIVAALGLWLPLLLLPNGVAMLLDTVGWWLAFARLTRRPRLSALFGVRVMCDALLLGLPSGSFVSESVQPYLLKRRCGVPLETAIVASLARKFFVVVSHGLFLAAATLLAWGAVESASHAAIGRGGLPWLLLGCSFLLVLAALVGATLTVQGRLADRFHRGLDRFGGRWLGSWLERNAPRFRKADEALALFFGERSGQLAVPLCCYLTGWLVRAVETLLFLRLIGVAVPLPAAMVIETALVLVRAAVVPVPAGLGVQDVGYLLCLRALGVPDATTVGAAFVVLKRGKDLAWILLGFLLLGVGPARRMGLLSGDTPADGASEG